MGCLYLHEPSDKVETVKEEPTKVKLHHAQSIPKLTQQLSLWRAFEWSPTTLSPLATFMPWTTQKAYPKILWRVALVAMKAPSTGLCLHDYLKGDVKYWATSVNRGGCSHVRAHQEKIWVWESIKPGEYVWGPTKYISCIIVDPCPFTYHTPWSIITLSDQVSHRGNLWWRSCTQ